MQTGFENIVQLFHAKNGDIRDNIANHKTPIDTSILDEYDRNLRINRFTYSVWREMIRRCNDNKFEQYKYYGGAGISVCNQWMDLLLTYRSFFHPFLSKTFTNAQIRS